MLSTAAIPPKVAAQLKDSRLFRNHFITATSTNLNLEI
jgi:hypothetical protein